MNYFLHIKLLRDTVFGRGDGVAGLVDIEVEHDEYGLPFLRGRALKGMLVYECADILYSLQQHSHLTEWKQAAQSLFGAPGSGLDDKAQLHIGNAVLPQELRNAVAHQMSLLTRDRGKQGQLRQDVLNALTTIRRQTAVEVDGIAKENSLRSVRLVLRDTELTAPLIFIQPPDAKVKGLLAACVKAFRRGGTHRNRGTGLLQVSLRQEGKDITEDWFNLFVQEVGR